MSFDLALPLSGVVNIGTERVRTEWKRITGSPGVGMTSEYCSPIRWRRATSQKTYPMTRVAWRERSNDLGDQASNEIESENNMKTKPLMNIRAFILSGLLLLATPLFGRESTDIIVMKNGDHLTGEIKGLNNGVLYVSIPSDGWLPDPRRYRRGSTR